MFSDATGFKKIYIATGYTDLRRGIEGLAAIVNGTINSVVMQALSQMQLSIASHMTAIGLISQV